VCAKVNGLILYLRLFSPLFHELILLLLLPLLLLLLLLPQVSIFLRRMGLKQYVDIFNSYDVDGQALVLLDEEDFANMEITVDNRIA